MMNKIRTYSELIKFSTFEERFYYLKLENGIGEETFGFDRYLNQMFYKSKEWRNLRKYIIVRDNGCDMGLDGYEIGSSLILIHHMNPISKEDILNKSDYLLNPEYLISVRKETHNAIHYGIDEYITQLFNANNIVQRTKNDTCPWKK